MLSCSLKTMKGYVSVALVVSSCFVRVSALGYLHIVAVKRGPSTGTAAVACCLRSRGDDGISSEETGTHRRERT